MQVEVASPNSNVVNEACGKHWLTTEGTSSQLSVDGGENVQVGEYHVFLERGGSTFRAVDKVTGETCRCRVLSPESCDLLLEVHRRLAGSLHFARLRSTRIQNGRLFVFLDAALGGDLHSLLRERARLDEQTAAFYYRQLAQAVQDAHNAGVVLRDLRLRNVVFSDSNRSQLQLDWLADSVCLREPADDSVSNTQQTCPAYISPEMLMAAQAGGTYPGRASDCWFLGVALFTVLTGQYPFNERHLSSLFRRIQSAYFSIPPFVSGPARSLIRALLRKEPSERLTVTHVLCHPWLAAAKFTPTVCLPVTVTSTQLLTLDAETSNERDLSFRLDEPLRNALSAHSLACLQCHRKTHSE